MTLAKVKRQLHASRALYKKTLTGYDSILKNDLDQVINEIENTKCDSVIGKKKA